MRSAKGSPSIVREINDRLVLDLFLHHGDLTRSELRRHSGLAQPTVLGAIERLQLTGLIEEVGEASRNQRGPRPMVFRLAGGVGHVVGVQILDDRITAVAVDLNGSWLAEPIECPLDPGRDPRQLADVIDAALEAAQLAGQSPLGIVVGVPGPVAGDSSDVGGFGVLSSWRGRAVAEVVERFGCVVRVLNGVHLIAVAEAERGVAGGADNLALLWWGPGLGMAYLIEGTLQPGATGSAGLIGSLLLPAGDDGLLTADKILTGPRLTAVLDQAGLDPAPLEGQLAQLFDPRNRGDGRESLRELLVHDLAKLVAAVVALLDPGVVVLQGQYSLAIGDELVSRLQVALREFTSLQARLLCGRVVEDESPILSAAVGLALRTARREAWGGRRVGDSP